MSFGMPKWIDDLENRTKAFATDVAKLATELERIPECQHAARQLARAAASVGANHRAVRRVDTDRWRAAKLQIVNEEADECVYWFEVIEKTGAQLDLKGHALSRESRELRAIFAKGVATLRRKIRDKQTRRSA
jgi:four helix bundle protein